MNECNGPGRIVWPFFSNEEEDNNEFRKLKKFQLQISQGLHISIWQSAWLACFQISLGNSGEWSAEIFHKIQYSPERFNRKQPIYSRKYPAKFPQNI
jgi:hypothetical protein